MPDARHRLSTTFTLACFLSGCVTYTRDLEHAARHYEAHEFAKALAVLRLLGEDEDALSEVERVRYAYLRGMTDLRLAALVPIEEPAKRESLRSCAREWVDRALRGVGRAPSPPLSSEELQRAKSSLAELGGVLGPLGACLPEG